MDNRKLTVGLIGCGRIGAYTRSELNDSTRQGAYPVNHAEAIKANSGLELVALCDLNSENLQRAAGMFNITNCYHDYRDLINQVKPDIISVATRTPGRCDILNFSIISGVKGIYIEKPLSTNQESCVETLNLVRQYGTKIAYGTVRRYMDAFRLCKKMVADGVIGELVQISVSIGSTLLMWSHPHSVDIMTYFSNAKTFDFVQASCLFREKYQGNENAIECDPVVQSAFIQFSNGISGLITQGGGNDVVLYGKSGTILIAGDGAFIQLRKRDQAGPYFNEVVHVDCEAIMSGAQRSFNELELAIKNNEPLSIDPDEIELSQEILLAIAYSGLLNGKKVRQGNLPRGFTVHGKFGDLTA